MSLIATVIADGLAIRPKPLPSSRPLVDSLTKGDKLKILPPPEKTLNKGWEYGEIVSIANGVLAEAREGKRGWFYAVDTVNIHDDRPRIDPDSGTPTWVVLCALIGLAVVISCVGIFWR